MNIVNVHACGSSINTILRAHMVAHAEFRMGVSVEGFTVLIYVKVDDVTKSQEGG